MKILVISDTHIGAGYEHRADALADTQAVLDQAADLAIDRGCDLFAHAGDLFHRTKPSPPELHAAKRFFDRLADAGIPGVLLHGNGSHSAAVGQASAEELFVSPWLRVSRRPEVFAYPGVSVCTLPAVPLAQLGAAAGSSEGLAEQAVGLLLRTARDLRAEAPTDRPAVLLGHWAVSGNSLPTGLPVEQLAEPVLPLAEVEALGFDAVLLGHIHRAAVLGGTERVFSLGSPMIHDFGEADVPNPLGVTPGGHGCWIIEFGPDVFDGYEYDFVPLTDRRFVTVDCDLTEMGRECQNCDGRGWTSRAAHAPGCDGDSCSKFGCPVEEQEQCGHCWGRGQGSGGDESDILASSIAASFPLTDAVVRVRYRASEEQHRRVDHAALERLIQDAGAHKLYGGIQWEPVREQRTRAEGLDESLGPMAALDLWLEAQSVNGAEGAGLRALLGEWLEAEA